MRYSQPNHHGETNIAEHCLARADVNGSQEIKLTHKHISAKTGLCSGAVLAGALFLSPALGLAAETSSGTGERSHGHAHHARHAYHASAGRHRTVAHAANFGRSSRTAATSIGTDISGATWRQVGTASYYGPRHNGHRAADGSTFHQDDLTAAHRYLPFGTRVLVTVPGMGGRSWSRSPIASAPTAG